MISKKALCVDLDGTFIKSDMLYESFRYCFFHNPCIFFLCIYWFIKGGKVVLKNELAKRFEFDPLVLKTNKSVFDLIREAKLSGRLVYLISASDQRIVEKFYQAYSDYFDGYYGSCLQKGNLSSEKKAKFLEKKFGNRGFDYIGNSDDDIAVWNSCSRAYCVGDRSSFRNIKITKDIIQNNQTCKEKLFSIIKEIRCHQWSKNLLIFVPIVTTRENIPINDFLYLIIAFVAFSFMASAVYIVNDLIDIDNDRSHSTKCNRPLASSAISIPFGFIIFCFLLITSVILSFFISYKFFLLVAIYLIVNFIYSIKLKKIYILDCIVLAMMYSYRIFLGIEVLNLDPSVWLLSFSLFFFLSLAFIKRYTELFKAQENKKNFIKGRGFIVDDMSLIMSMAVGSGFLSLLIFVLYINDDLIKNIFSSIWFVYFCIPVLLYWLARIFIISKRGKMKEDPVVFALKDRLSLVLGISFILLYLFGRII